MNLAARVTKGECFGQEGKSGVPLSVIYQTAEDGLADTVKPRLEEAERTAAGFWLSMTGSNP